MRVMTTLPFPDARLSPNKRLHRTAKSKIIKAQRAIGFSESIHLRGQIKGDIIALTLVFYPPDKRPRDLDNLLSSCKAMLDGVAHAIDINDKCFNPITIAMGEVRKNDPCVVLTVDNGLQSP